MDHEDIDSMMPHLDSQARRKSGEEGFGARVQGSEGGTYGSCCRGCEDDPTSLLARDLLKPMVWRHIPRAPNGPV
jgi:hypothetical protein